MTTTKHTEPNIIDAIVDYLNSFMVFTTPEQPVGVALWILHTYTFSPSFPFRPFTTPYLYVNSAEPQCGKSTLIDILEPVCMNPERGDDMTTSVMFRLIDSVQPTLFMDECDTVWTGSSQANKDKQGLINGGYKRSGYIWRNAPGPDGPTPTKFGTFGAKLLAGIDNGGMPDTVLTRSIEILLKRVATLNDDGEIVGPDGIARTMAYAFNIEPAAEALVERINAFMSGWKANFVQYVPKPIPGISPRSWEVLMPLIQIAHAAGREAECRAALTTLILNKPKRDTPGTVLLREVKALFDSTGADRMFGADILQHVDIPNAKAFRSMLKEFGIPTPTAMTIKNRQSRGYYRRDFQSAWDANL